MVRQRFRYMALQAQASSETKLYSKNHQLHETYLFQTIKRVGGEYGMALARDFFKVVAICPSLNLLVLRVLEQHHNLIMTAIGAFKGMEGKQMALQVALTSVQCANFKKAVIKLSTLNLMQQITPKTPPSAASSLKAEHTEFLANLKKALGQ